MMWHVIHVTYQHDWRFATAQGDNHSGSEDLRLSPLSSHSHVPLLYLCQCVKDGVVAHQTTIKELFTGTAGNMS